MAAAVPVVATGCGAAGTAYRQPRPPVAAPVPRFRHIFTIVMENLPYGSALEVPAIARLAHAGAYARLAFGASHPSLPNYLALTSGSTDGVASDCWFCYVDVPNVASEMAAHHIAWAAYMEGLPAAGSLIPYWPFTDYAGKHNPFRYYVDIRKSPALAAHIRPLSDLTALLKGPAAHVPRYAFITPNLCHDGHNCPATAAGAWLASYVASIERSAAYRDGGVIFILWDEGSGSDTRGLATNGTVSATGGGGHILIMALGEDVRPGTVLAKPVGTVSVLKTEEEAMGLPLLGETGLRRVPDLAGFFRPTP